MKDPSDLVIFYKKKKPLSDLIMGSFTKQQVAVNREQRLKQWRPFVSVCERRVKEPQR